MAPIQHQGKLTCFTTTVMTASKLIGLAAANGRLPGQMGRAWKSKINYSVSFRLQ